MIKNFSTDLPCIACKKVTENGNTFHHLYTQKTYPEFKHEEWNLIPVCLSCHDKFHKAGTLTMSAFYPSVKEWLLNHGWEFTQSLSKWRHFQ